MIQRDISCAASLMCWCANLRLRFIVQKSSPHNKTHKQTTLWRTRTYSDSLTATSNQNMIPSMGFWGSKFGRESSPNFCWVKPNFQSSIVLSLVFFFFFPKMPLWNNSVFIAWTTTAANPSDFLIFQHFINLKNCRKKNWGTVVGPRCKRSIFGIAGLNQNRGQCPLVLFKVQLLIQEEISITNCSQPWFQVISTYFLRYVAEGLKKFRVSRWTIQLVFHGAPIRCLVLRVTQDCNLHVFTHAYACEYKCTSSGIFYCLFEFVWHFSI